MHRRSLLGLGLALPLLALPGCVLFRREPPAQVVTSKNLDRLVGRPWELRAITMDGQTVVMHLDAKMSILFDADGLAKGLGAVNQFTRAYQFDDNALLIWDTKDFALTRRSGPPELRDKEAAYLAALRKVTRAIVGKTTLTLQDEDADTVLTFLAPGTL